MRIGWLITTARTQLIDCTRSQPRERERIARHVAGKELDVPAIDFASISVEQGGSCAPVVAAVMGVMTLGVIVHVLASGLRANRRDVAVVRALGFRRRVVSVAVGRSR